MLLLAWSAQVPAMQRIPDPLVVPPPAEVPGGLSTAQEEQAIVAAARYRAWTVVDQQPGMIVLKYAREDYSATVSVAYDTKQVTVAYKDSENLGYAHKQDYATKETHDVIHPSYNRWVVNLERDIEIEMLVLTLK
jgi:hypothetical protein